MRMRSFIIALSAVLFCGLARAEIVDITTDATVRFLSSYSFGDWIFEDANPPAGFNLVDTGTEGSPEDFIVSHSSFAGDFTLRRLDNLPFNLLSIFRGGFGVTVVGGVSTDDPAGFQTFNFTGQPGVTNVTSVLFSPLPAVSYIQLSRFEVATIPEPTTLILATLSFLAIAYRRRRSK